MRTIECPNCGAPATNSQNCNFCGSLLVRFADKGIDLSTTSYLNNDEVIPGLINHLEKNLNIQNSGKTAGTDLFLEDPDMKGGKNAFCFVAAANSVRFRDHQMAFPQAVGTSIATVFDFILYEDTSIAPKEIEQHNRFKTLPSFPLFIEHKSYGCDNVSNYVYYQYAIDFGKDAQGAARLISEIAYKIYNWSVGQPIEIYTEEYDALLKIRESLGVGSAETGQNGVTEQTDWKKWIWIGVAIVGGLIYLLSL